MAHGTTGWLERTSRSRTDISRQFRAVFRKSPHRIPFLRVDMLRSALRDQLRLRTQEHPVPDAQEARQRKSLSKDQRCSVAEDEV
jgi:hypothetical protein